MRRFSLLTLLTSLLIAGCTEVTIEQSKPVTEINLLPDLTASFADEGETRTFVEDSKYLRWHEADLITAFFGNTLNRQYKFKGKTGDNSGTFSLVPSGELGTGNDLSSIYAVYPYDENTTITDNGVISLTLPATQTYAENSFGKGANTMVAVTESVEDTFLSFKNACGYLKLKLYGDNVTIASIEVTGINEEKIAGSATATMEFSGVPTIAMNDEATTSVTLDCGEGVAIGATTDTATEFWIVLPETTFEGGITITATNTDGAVFSKSTTNTVAITRNDIQPMVALKAEFATAKPANNEIWYTNGSTTEATAPYKTDVFGANIVSNTYDADKECWVIEFDSDATKIGEYAFRDRNCLTSVTIPNSVTKIGAYAFNGCTNLKKFEGKFAADNGRCLIKDNVIIAYAEASGTEYTIPDSVTTIGDSTFYNCSSLTSVTIPDSVTTIGGSAFYNCSSLMSITIPKNITKIERYTFRYCTSLTSITIPDSVTTIGDQAFSGCLSLKSVDIGSRVTTINYRAFEDCASLTSITIPDNVKEIYQAAFDGCKSLSEVIIGKGLTYIDSPFENISNDSVLTINSNIPNSFELEELDNAGCFEGSSFKYVVIENGVTNVGDRAFQNCPNLTSVKFNDANVEISEKGFEGCSQLSRVEFGTALKSIGPHAFANCVRLTHVSIPDSTTSCGPYAFYGCEKLSNVILGENITVIGGSAFRGCTSLTDIVIPKNVKNIYDYAFADCPNLQVIECEPIEPPTLYGPNVFANNHLSRVIYVNETCLSDYRAADYWNQYYSFIIY